MSPASLLEEMPLPAKSLQKFSARLDKQLARLERKLLKAMPQLARRAQANSRITRSRS